MRTAALVALLLGTANLHGQAAFTWSGSGNTTLGVTDPLNWSGNATATPGADVAFGLSAPPTVNVPTSISVGNITFTNTAPTPRPAYTFSGQNEAALTITGGITVNASGNVSGNGNVTLDATLPIVLTPVSHFADIASGATLTIAGSVGEASASASITKSGAGTLALSGSNSFSGGLTATGGTVELNGANSRASGDWSFSSSSILKVNAAGGFSSGNLLLADSAGVNANAAGAITGTEITLSGESTVNAGSANALSSDTDIYFSGATGGTGGKLLLNGFDTTVGEIGSGISTAGLIKNGSSTTNATLTVTNGPESSSTYTGQIQDGGTGRLSLIKNGSGTLTLSGSNTFTGTTTINCGTLVVGNSLALAGSTLDYSNASGSLNFDSFVGAATFGGLSGSADLTLSRNFDGAYAVALTVGANNGNTTYSGALIEPAFITGGSSLTKTGTGMLTLSSNGSSYTGATTIKSGTLTVNSLADGGVDSGIGASSNLAANLVLDGGVLQYTGAAQSTDRLFTIGANGSGLDASGGGALVFSSNGSIAFTGTGNVSRIFTLTGSSTASNTLTPILGDDGAGITSLTKTGTGTWVLAATNTYSGTTSLNGGTLVISSDGNLGAAPASPTANNLLFNGGTLETTTTFALNSNRGINLNTGGGTFNTDTSTTLTYGGVITGGFGLTKTGGGTLTLTGANNYAGGTTINAGTLTLGAVNTLATGGDVAVNGGVLEVDHNQTIRGLSGSGFVNIGSNVTFTANLPSPPSSGNASTFAGKLSGDTSTTFAEAGAGTLTLSGDSSSSYAGAITVNSGTLVVTNAGALGSTATGTTVSSPGTLLLSGVAVGVEPVTLAGGTLTGTGTASLSGPITLTANSILGTPGSGSDSLTLSGNIGQSGGTNGFTKTGPGTLVLSGSSNTFGGPINVNGGTLSVGTPNAIPNVGVQVGAGATFDVANSTTISTLGGTGATTVAGGKTLTLSNGAGNFSSVVSGAGGVTFNNPSTIVADQLYTGATTVGGGTLSLGNGGTAGSVAGNIAINLGTPNTGGVQFNHGANDVAYGGVVSGNGNLGKQGTGNLTLTGHNTYTGITSISGGTLLIGTADALPASTAVGFASGAKLAVANDQTIAGFAGSFSDSLIEATGTLDVTLGNATFGTGFYGVISGPGAFRVGPSHDPESVTGGHAVALFGDNTYSGGTTIDATGALLLGNNGSTGSIQGNVADNGVLIFNRGDSMTFSGMISGSGSVSQGVLSGGTYGTTILTAANTYTGGTTVYGGTLLVNNASGSGTGTGGVAVSQAASAAITGTNLEGVATLGGTGTINGALAVNSGGVIAPGGEDQVGTLQVGNTTFFGGSGFAFDFNATVGTPGQQWDLLSVSGQLTIDSSAATTPIFVGPNPVSPLTPTNIDLTHAYSWQFITTTGGITGFSTNAFAFDPKLATYGNFAVALSGNNLVLNFTPVPEPSTWALLALGLGAVAVGARRRRTHPRR